MLFRTTFVPRWIALAVSIFGIPSFAQTNYGAIRGHVVDTAAVIRNASITLTNLGTKVSRTTASNSAGDYVFPSVDPGRYSVRISAPGYKSTEYDDIVVGLEKTVTEDAVLAPGVVAETVVVSGETSQIDTASASNGETFTAQQLQDLPSLGRNPFIIARLDNNIVFTASTRDTRAEDQSGTSSFSVSGVVLGANNFVVDGIPVSTSSGGATFIPSIEAVSDSKLQANDYNASVGRTGGGVFNTTLKSGSKDYHGTLYGATRQTDWTANTFFGNRNGYTDASGVYHSGAAPRGDMTTYLYAGAFGGPVPNPHKFHFLKDTFFWLTEEGYRQSQPDTSSTSEFVPTAQERTGIFSSDSVTLYDPTSTFVNGVRTSTLSSATIPGTYINPIGSAIVNAYPNPTIDGVYGSDNRYGSDTFKTRSDEFVGKLDHTFAPWWKAAVSYVHLATQEPDGGLDRELAANNGVLYRKNDGTAVNSVITVNSTTVITAAFGFNRYYSNHLQYSTGFDQASGFTYNGTSYGFPNSYASQLQSKTYPSISLSGVTDAVSLGGANGGPSIQSSRNVVLTVNKELGRHDINFGYIYRNFQSYSDPTSGGNGSFTFNGEYTSQDGASVSNGPNAIADLLLGLPSSASVTVNAASLNMSSKYHAAFVQDNFRVNRKLSLSYGLRYEYELGPYEVHNIFNVGFDPNTTYSYAGYNGDVTAHGALAFAGQNGYPTHAGDPSHWKFAPRVGAIYTLTPNTVIRGGFGIFYAPVDISGAAASTGYTQSTLYSPGNATAATSVGSNAYLSDPFSSGLLDPTKTALGNLTGIGGSVSTIDFNRKYPHVYQYSLDVQQQLPHEFTLKIGYVGSHEEQFPNTVNINQLSDSVLASYAGGSTNLSSKVTNPYYAATVGGYSSALFGIIGQSTVALGQTLLPYPQFTSVNVSKSTGHGLYNALNVKLQKNLSHGLNFLATYTWASSWDNIYGSQTGTHNEEFATTGVQDNYKQDGEFARSSIDVTNRFSFGGAYNLPFRKTGGSDAADRVINAIISRWQINDITEYSSGLPLTITQTDLSSGTYGTTGVGGSTQRPNLIAGVSACRSGNPESRLGGSSSKTYFNLDAFSPALPYTYGNAPRTLSCKGPGYANTDLSLFKSFGIAGHARFEFRAEALNALNTPHFGPPSTNLTFSSTGLTSATFTPSASNTTSGAITSELGFPRIIQLGGKIIF